MRPSICPPCFHVDAFSCAIHLLFAQLHCIKLQCMYKELSQAPICTSTTVWPASWPHISHTQGKICEQEDMIRSSRYNAARPSACMIHLPFGTVRRLQSTVRPSVSAAGRESDPSMHLDRRAIVGAWLAAMSIHMSTQTARAEPAGRIFFDVKLEGVPAGK